MKVYLSTGAFRTHSLVEVLRLADKYGVNRIELSSGMQYQPDVLDVVRAHSKSMQFLVHNYFPPPQDPFVLNLASLDSEILNRSVKFCEDAIDLSAELGAPFYSVHSGFAFSLSPAMLGKPAAQSNVPLDEYVPYEQAYEIFLKSVLHLSGYAFSRGLHFLIENNVVSPHYLRHNNTNALLMASADEIIQFMQDANTQSLKLLADVGHINVTATALGFSREEFLKKVAPWVGAIHLSDNDGIVDQNLPFDSSAWFYPLLRDFTNTPLVIESYNLSRAEMEKQYQALNHLGKRSLTSGKTNSE